MSLNDHAKEKFFEILEKLSEDRDETIDKVFTAWLAENVFFLDNEDDIDRCIEVGSSGDWGIDFFHMENNPSKDQYIAWGQAKFSKNFDYVLDRKDFEEFVNTINILEDPPLSSKKALKDISDDFMNSRTRISPKRMYFFFCGKMSEQVKELLNDSEWIAKKKDPDTQWLFYDATKILELIEAPETPSLTIEFTPNVMNVSDNITGKKSLVGYIKASEVARLYSDPVIRNTINNLNLREYQGRTKFNQGIADTLNNDAEKSKFWKFNNGITATCELISDDTNSSTEYRFKNLKIVNGRQTSMTLYKKESLLDDNVTVKIIIHETVDNEERSLISKYTNTQNAIKASDIITNKELITKLAIQFTKFPNWFFETQRGHYNMLDKKSKNKFTKKRRLEKEPMSRKYLAFVGDPYFAIKTRDEELLLVESNFNRIFKDKCPMDFIVSHIFYQLIEEIDEKWKNSSDEKLQKRWPYIHKRIIKFYMLGFIKNSLDNLESSEKENILKNIFDNYDELKTGDEIEQKYLDIVIAAFNEFKVLYSEKNPHETEDYTDDDVKKYLLKYNYFPILQEHKESKMELYPDAILAKLKKVIE